jgi:hypothetical protein
MMDTNITHIIRIGRIRFSNFGETEIDTMMDGVVGE